MSQIRNFFRQIYITFQDMKTYNFTTTRVSVHGKEAVTIPAIIPEVDMLTSYYDNPKYNCLRFHPDYLQIISCVG